MPKAHINQWKHNREFLAQVNPDFSDWAVTAAFYAALQAVDALLKFDKVPGIVSHATRNGALANYKRYEFIFERYQPLYDLSQIVRYQPNPMTWIPWDKIETQIIRRYLYPIENSVQKLMGAKLNLATIVMKIPSKPAAEK